MTGRVAAVLSAAGRGERFGAAEPKALVEIRGVPMLVHALRGLASVSEISIIVVVAPPDRLDTVRSMIRHAGFTGLQVVPGGETRTASVRAGVAVLPSETDVILVHDAARPFTPTPVIESVIGAIRSGADAVVPGIPVIDTVKVVDEEGVVIETPARGRLRAIQTPQGFRATMLRAALDEPEDGATDDAQMVERLGGVVRVVPGHPDALKITTPEDLLRAEALAESADVR